MDLSNMPKNRLMFLAAIIIVVVVGGILVLFNLRPKPTMNAVSLTLWGTDSRSVWEPVIGAYTALRPNVQITYTEVGPATYEDALIKAFAVGQGPDVFMIGNHDLQKYKYLIAVPSAEQITSSTLGVAFPKAVIDDFVSEGQVLAMPLYMDTLALVYNRDMLDQIGIASPPLIWQEIMDIVPNLRKTNSEGQITSSAIALGGSEKTVKNSTDILNLLMLQNGVIMNSNSEQAAFSRSDKATGALRFYLDFSNPSSAVYTWNDSGASSEESFLAGKTAMMLAYRKDILGLKAKNAFINYGVAPAPQISADRSVNYPSYQGLTVWKQSRASAWGWDFAILTSSNATVNKAYLTATNRPPASRELITEMSNDAELGIFAKQSLTARSWHMPEYGKVKNTFSSVIQAVLRGELNLEGALQNAEKQINSL